MNQTNLFEYMKEERTETDSPLAYRMRPKTLDEIIGQEHILGKDKLLTRAIRADRLSSVIFYGPPGCGKTTIAKVIANTTKANFHELNATASGKKDMESVVSEAKEQFEISGRKTILFIDEIHRFNKAQQDYLLPFVENGTLILIGATTENPYFEVNGALISRSMVFELKPLTVDDLKILIKRTISDQHNGLGPFNAEITESAADFLADIAEGDARRVLNALELAVLTTDRSDDGKIIIDISVVEECVEKRAVRYDKDGDNHYDVISAFIKSMRGSDPDAAAYYLEKMIYGGEDIKFIARRIMICAAEDVGNADPEALQLATAAAVAVERIGLPESKIILMQAATYVASAPKSNSVINAVSKADEAILKYGNANVPVYLKDAHYSGAAKLGVSGYLYPHNYEGHYVTQQYLPDAVKNLKIYEPGELGYEKNISEYISKLKKRDK